MSEWLNEELGDYRNGNILKKGDLWGSANPASASCPKEPNYKVDRRETYLLD